MKRSNWVWAIIHFCCVGCSPGYVLRAGWEEARILWRREPIRDVLQDQSVDPVIRSKLQLVLDARAFAEEQGLTPGGSYQKYSSIDRAVLVWVLSAAPKTKLVPYTWWFPIVGSVPYKGFFELNDAKSEAQKLEAKGLDTFVRPSPAFSTLGWFDDPLLSTVLAQDEVALVDTVIHEILHSTVWVPGSVEFNESLANFVGSIGSREFFRSRNENERYQLAAGRWEDELTFARFLHKLTADLTQCYASGAAEAEVLRSRQQIFSDGLNSWQAQVPTLKCGGYAQAGMHLNNAQILAYQTYLMEPELFAEAYEKSGGTLKDFLSLIRRVKEVIDAEKLGAFEALRRVVHEASPR